MDFMSLLPSLISAGASIGGGFMSAGGAAANNAQNIAMQRETNAMNMQMFKDNMNWQTEMANTAYQRQMADMRAAGLNPILAYTKAGGAAAPSMGTPHLDAPKGENTELEKGRSVSLAASSAIEAAKTYADIKNANEQNKLLEEQTKKTAAETALTNTNTLKAASETDLTKEQIKNMPWLQELLKGQTSAATGAAAASHAAAGASGAYAGLTREQEKQLRDTGDSTIGKNAASIMKIFQSTVPTPRYPTTGKNAPIPGAKSLWDLIKERLP